MSSHIFLESTTFVLERAKRLGASALPDKIFPEVETLPSTQNSYPILQQRYYCVALHSRRVFFLGNDIAVEMMMRHVFVCLVLMQRGDTAQRPRLRLRHDAIKIRQLRLRSEHQNPQHVEGATSIQEYFYIFCMEYHRLFSDFAPMTCLVLELRQMPLSFRFSGIKACILIVCLGRLPCKTKESPDRYSAALVQSTVQDLTSLRQRKTSRSGNERTL